MNKIEYMRGDGQKAAQAAEIINFIIREVNNSGNRKPDAVLYLGRIQHRAIMMIETGDKMDTLNNKTFAGWPVIWVIEDNYVRLAC